MHDEQIGFKKGGRTAGHIFKLKTLFCKYFKHNKKIYACFIDLRKAFDSVIHPALLHKLLTYGISGKFYNIIASMYVNNVLQIKTGSAMLSDKFLATVGVRQDDNLSPNIFNLYLNDIVDALNKEVCNPLKLGSTNFNCLLYADDIILLSESEAGLQKCLDKLSQYCESWCLNVNYEKAR